MRKILKYILILLAVFVAVFILANFLIKPSNDRDWAPDQQILPHADTEGSLITIHNIRNFSYTSATSYTAEYYDKTFDTDKIKRVWYVVEPFSGVPGSAHTFLSFEFENDEYVSISAEIRKEKGESFHPLRGMLRQYELMYVIADEKDVIKLRSNYRKDLVYVYPIKTTPEKARVLFVGMIERANNLREKPEFYNTLTNTCTTNIVAHVNEIVPKRVPFFNLRILFPANSDKLAYDLGLIDTDLSFEEARKKFFINDRALKYADDPEFSKKIRR